MQKLSIIIFFAFLQMGLIHSQSSLEVGFATGTEFNIASSSYPVNIWNYRATPGFNLAFRLQHNFDSRFALVSGIEYSRMYWYRNSKATIIPEDYSDNYINVGNQLRLPILFQYSVGKSKSRFFTNIGPTFMATFSDLNANAAYLPEDQSWVMALPPIVQTWNMGGILSAGYSYSFKEKMRFFTELRFLVPFVANPAYSTNCNTTRNLTVSLTVGLSFTTSGNKISSK